MKKIFGTLLLLAAVSFGTAAQEAPQKALNRPQKPAKGYYSIGNNAEKLASYSNPVVLSTTRTVTERAPKGYYSIVPRERNMVVVDLPPARKPITKGYYSIGSKQRPAELEP